MPFSLTYEEDQQIDNLIKDTLKEYSEFFGITWPYRNLPQVFYLKTRQDIDRLLGEKTYDWTTGFTRGIDIFVMDENSYGIHTQKIYDETKYLTQIRHELCHHFYYRITHSHQPNWLFEGLAIFLSGQTKQRPRPDQFKNCLKFVEKLQIGEETVYQESGFVIETLIKNYGKEKLLELLNQLKTIKNGEEFLNTYQQIYGFELNYQNLNKIYQP